MNVRKKGMEFEVERIEVGETFLIGLGASVTKTTECAVVRVIG